MMSPPSSKCRNFDAALAQILNRLGLIDAWSGPSRTDLIDILNYRVGRAALQMQNEVKALRRRFQVVYGKAIWLAGAVDHYPCKSKLSAWHLLLHLHDFSTSPQLRHLRTDFAVPPKVSSYIEPRSMENRLFIEHQTYLEYMLRA